MAMVDFATFKPANVNQFVNVLSTELAGLGKKWWETNSALVHGYLRSLAEAFFQTKTALSEGRIKADQADRIMHMQEVAFTSTLQFTKYMTFALAQKVLDMTFRLVGWAMYNYTGINLFPQLVDAD
jgi:hypothetical protein